MEAGLAIATRAKPWMARLCTMLQATVMHRRHLRRALSTCLL